MSEEATALAATLRACIREGDEYEAISRIGMRAADLLERQAAQLAALRTGADTEDLHAAPADRAAQLEAEADALHAVAEGWRKRAEEAEATLDARSAGYAEAVEAARSEIRRQALEEAAAIPRPFRMRAPPWSASASSSARKERAGAPAKL